MWWKIQFNDGLDGFGWLHFNESMEAIGLYDAQGNEVIVPCGYFPVEFSTQPEWL